METDFRCKQCRCSCDFVFLEEGNNTLKQFLKIEVSSVYFLVDKNYKFYKFKISVHCGITDFMQMLIVAFNKFQMKNCRKKCNVGRLSVMWFPNSLETKLVEQHLHDIIMYYNLKKLQSWLAGQIRFKGCLAPGKVRSIKEPNKTLA